MASIAITGCGLVTPLGNGVASTWSALVDDQCIVRHAGARMERCRGVDRIYQLAGQAAHQAIAAAAWSSARGAALVIGTSKGPIEGWIMSGGVEPAGISIADAIGKNLGADGREPRLTISAACASGLYAIIRAAMLIQRGEVSRALVIGVESSLHPLFIGCFQNLGVAAGEGELCRPFDEQRRGFFLSEAAAAVCLEATDSPASLCLAGYGAGGAAGHLTAGDVDGKALRHVLAKVAAGRAIQLVHAHGTGTVVHDAVELDAIASVTGGTAAVYSHKAALGHSLGAAGIVATVLSAEMHRRQFVPANLNTTRPLHESVGLGAHRRLISRSLVLAAGFGGSTAAICLESP